MHKPKQTSDIRMPIDPLCCCQITLDPAALILSPTNAHRNSAPLIYYCTPTMVLSPVFAFVAVHYDENREEPYELWL